MKEKSNLLIDNVLKKNTIEFLNEIKELMKEIEGLIKREKKPGRTQFNSLMNAVNEASCVEELILFISYQESKKEGWNKSCENNKTIAENIIKHLLTIQEKIIAEIEETESLEEEDKRIIKLKIAEKYFGYLYWSVSAVGIK